MTDERVDKRKEDCGVSEHKFTSDGRKVAIIGSLNSKETIVQEIFVSDGTEFPAGEHFVVKTLLDAPAETYQSKKNRQLEDSIKQLESRRNQIQKEIDGFRVACASAAAKIKWINGIKDQEVERIVEHIKSVICGEYTHILMNDYNGPEIAEWDAELFSRTDGYGEDRRFDGVRLCSLFGMWNGRLELDWRVHSYSDGSGSGAKSFVPCKSLREAVGKAKAIIDSKDHLSDKDYAFCLKHGIDVDPMKNAARLESKAECVRKQMERHKSELAALELKLAALEDK